VLFFRAGIKAVSNTQNRVSKGGGREKIRPGRRLNNRIGFSKKRKKGNFVCLVVGGIEPHETYGGRRERKQDGGVRSTDILKRLSGNASLGSVTLDDQKKKRDLAWGKNSGKKKRWKRESREGKIDQQPMRKRKNEKFERGKMHRVVGVSN